MGVWICLVYVQGLITLYKGFSFFRFLRNVWIGITAGIVCPCIIPAKFCDILPGYRGEGEITDRPALSLFSPCKQKLTRRFSFAANGSPKSVTKRFITFFHIWFFFSPRFLDYFFFLYWLSWKQASRHVTQNWLRDWVTACFGSRIKTFQNWKSSGLGTWLRTPRSNISLTFPEKSHTKVQRMQRYVE